MGTLLGRWRSKIGRRAVIVVFSIVENLPIEVCLIHTRRYRHIDVIISRCMEMSTIVMVGVRDGLHLAEVNVICTYQLTVIIAVSV
eukprot:XP_001710199.1 Hypothetical protein GL50803_38364 [Giardia lamblia ATCC 50803]